MNTTRKLAQGFRAARALIDSGHRAAGYALEHAMLCHEGDSSRCCDGCDQAPDPNALRYYKASEG